MRSGYLFRGRKISRKIKIREYSENFLHAKNTCYTVDDLEGILPVQGPIEKIYIEEVVIHSEEMKKTKACGPDCLPMEVAKHIDMKERYG